MTIGLLGTEVTMEYDFYLNCLTKNGMTMLLPSKRDRSNIDKMIFTELARGKFSGSTRIQFEKIIKRMKNNGAEGIILGCTKLPMLFLNEQYDIPMFDTLKLHAFAAVYEALQTEQQNKK